MPTFLQHSTIKFLTKVIKRRSHIIASWLLATIFLGACGFGIPATTTEPNPVPAASQEETSTGETLPDSQTNAPLPTTQPVAQAPAQSTTGEWIYTGDIEPKNQITIVTEVGGHVLELNVNEGMSVTPGQILLSVDSTELEAQRAQALATLQVTQAQLELLQIQASDADIEAARATVVAAEAAYQRALNGPNEDDLAVAQSQLFQAEAAVRRAQAAYDQVSANPLVAALPESVQLQQATLTLEAAQAQYDNLVQGTPQDVTATAYAQLATARAQLQRLENGPEETQLEAAQAQVSQAETNLYLAQLQVEKATVRSPINGIVAQTNLTVGTMAVAGSPALLLYSPKVKIVIAVEENRIAQLTIGQPAMIQVTAYPEQTFEGTITAITPQLDATTRTARITIEPLSENTQLIPGMIATVQFITEEMTTEEMTTEEITTEEITTEEINQE